MERPSTNNSRWVSIKGCKKFLTVLCLVCCIIGVIGVIYLLYFATEDEPNLAIIDHNMRFNAAVNQLNNTGVDSKGQQFKYQDGQN